MELFEPVVDEAKFHPAFASLLQNRNSFNEAVIANWAEGFVDRDNMFVHRHNLRWLPKPQRPTYYFGFAIGKKRRCPKGAPILCHIRVTLMEDNEVLWRA